MTTGVPFLDQLSALADPIRSRLLLLLDKHELSVGELCTVLQLPQSTVSRHLKTLVDEGWIVSRGEATSRFYKMISNRLPPASSRLWKAVYGPISEMPAPKQDAHRAESVLAKRRDKAQIFFVKSADVWDKMRTEMIGARTDLLTLLDLLDDAWTVGDLGCGAGHISEALSPCVHRVIA